MQVEFADEWSDSVDESTDDLLSTKPDKTVSAKEFGVESEMKIPAFSKPIFSRVSPR